MKTTTKAPPGERLAEAPRYQERIPEPPAVGEDRGKWKLVGRGSGVPQGPPLIGVEVHFDHAQSAWLRAEARRTGLEYHDVLKKLVDEARGGG